MQAQYLVLDKSGEGQPVEKLVDSGENRVLTFGVLLYLFRTLVSEAEIYVDLTVLVVSANEMHLLGVNALESQQQTDSLERVTASVHEIPQENVVEVLNVLLLPVLVGSAVKGKERHKVGELAVDVSENLKRRLCLQDHGLADDYLLGEVAERDDLVSAEVDLERLSVHVDGRLQQHIEEVGSHVHLAVQFLLEVHLRRLALLAPHDRLQQLQPLLLLRNRLDLLLAPLRLRRLYVRRVLAPQHSRRFLKGLRPQRLVTGTHRLSAIDGFELVDQDRRAFEQFSEGNLVDGVSGHVGGGKFKAPVDHELLVLQPATVPKPLQTLKRTPLARLSVEHLKGQSLVDAVGAPAHNQHQRANEQTAVLIPRRRSALLWSTNPVPSTSSMSPQSPAVAQRIVVQSPPSENDDHASSSARSAERSRVVDSGAGKVSLAFDLCPSERRLGDVEHPAVVDALVADVSSKHHQVWLRVGKSVPVSLARSAVADINHVPNSHALPDVQVEEVVRGQSSRASGSSVNHDFIGLDADRSVGRARGGRGASG